MRRWRAWVPAAAAVIFVFVGAVMLVGTWRQRASLAADIEQLARAGIERDGASQTSNAA